MISPIGMRWDMIVVVEVCLALHFNLPSVLALQSFSFPSTVREKASYLREILNNTARIREEREKARQLQKKFVGVAGKGGRVGYQTGKR
jgi:hypothetical protein